MIRFLATFVLIGVAAADCSINACDGGNSLGFPSEVCHDSNCTMAIKEHIKEEFKAAFLYLHMGAMFAQDGVARPGIAKFMLESATEERSHAMLMLDYLNKRGIKLTKSEIKFKFDKDTIIAALTSMNEGMNFVSQAERLLSEMTMQQALKMALLMEINVTNLIIKVVEDCGCDYHAADIFTNPILDEQYDGIRKLQGAIREFEDLLQGHSVGMVNFMMDQKILKGGL